MRVRAVAGAVIPAALSLTGCSDQGDGGHKGSNGSTPSPSHQAKSLAELSVPAAYDAGEGWDTTLGGVPKQVANMPLAAVPGADGGIAGVQGLPAATPLSCGPLERGGSGGLQRHGTHRRPRTATARRRRLRA